MVTFAAPSADEGRQERHGRRTASHDDDAAAGERHPLRPVLRVHHLSSEVALPREVDDVARLVGVVARREVDEPGRVGHLPVGRPRGHGPSGVAGRPREPLHPLTEVQALGDAELAGGRLDVVADVRPRRQRGVTAPRAEGKAQGVHVRVRTDAGVAEEVPRPADRVPRLEDGPGGAWAVHREPTPRVDTRDAGSDDEHVDVERHGGWVWHGHRVSRALGRGLPRGLDRVCPV